MASATCAFLVHRVADGCRSVGMAALAASQTPGARRRISCIRLSFLIARLAATKIQFIRAEIASCLTGIFVEKYEHERTGNH